MRRKYFETFKDMRDYINTHDNKILDYGFKLVGENKDKIYYVLVSN